MSETREVKFRTVFGGGYQKSDVNAYIASMQAESDSVEGTLKATIDNQQRRIAELQTALGEAKTDAERIDEMKRMLDEQIVETDILKTTCENRQNEILVLREEKAAAEKEADALRAQVQAAGESTEKLSVSLASLGEECEKLREEARIASENAAKQAAIAAAAQAAAQAAREENDRLRTLAETAGRGTEAVEEQPVEIETEELSETAVSSPVQGVPEDYEKLRKKAEQFDKMSAQVGEIMLRANADADEIVKKAQADADRILKNADSTLANIKNHTRDAADALIERINGRLMNINTDCRDDILLDLEDIQSALGTLQSNIRMKYADIRQKLEYARNEMEIVTEKALEETDDAGKG